MDGSVYDWVDDSSQSETYPLAGFFDRPIFLETFSSRMFVIIKAEAYFPFWPPFCKWVWEIKWIIRPPVLP